MVNTNQTEGKQNLYYYLSGIWEVLYDDDEDDNHPFSQNSICIILNICCTMDGKEKQFVQNKKKQLSKIQMHQLGVLVLSKSAAGGNMVLLIPKQLAKFIHCFSMFHITHSLINHYRQIECGRTISKIQKKCKKHISCSTTPLLIQGHTEVVFLANIGNFTSRRRIFGLRFLYFGILVFL